MLNMDQKLIKRQEEGRIIRTGIVGAGQMGRGMVTQMVLMQGMMPAIVSDIKVENAVNAFKCIRGCHCHCKDSGRCQCSHGGGQICGM